MKKTKTMLPLSLLLSFLLLFTLALPATAEFDYDLIYDEAEAFDESFLSEYGRVILPDLAERYEMDIRVDILADRELSMTLPELAAYYYDRYEYGYGYNLDGLTLTIWLQSDNNGFELRDYTVYANGFGENYIDSVSDALQPWLMAESWSGDFNADENSLLQALYILSDTVETVGEALLAEGYSPSAEPFDNPNGKTADVLPDYSASSYVMDAAGLLNATEAEQLAAKAGLLAEEYGCGVYLMTVPNFKTVTSQREVYEAARELYQRFDLGLGTDKTGELLLLSMAERDYALITHGEGNTIFNEYAQIKLEDEFLDDFKDDDWYNGFDDYLDMCETALKMAAEGTPMNAANDPGTLMAGRVFGVLMALGISLAIFAVLASGHRNVMEKEEASAFLVPNSFHMTGQRDNFVNRNVSRRYIPPKSSGGGSSHSGGGFSGRSGKF